MLNISGFCFPVVRVGFKALLDAADSCCRMRPNIFYIAGFWSPKELQVSCSIYCVVLLIKFVLLRKKKKKKFVVS